MAALAISLLAFFRGYCSPGSLHGTLQFRDEAGNAEQFSSEFRPSPTSKDSPWAELVVQDPIQGGEDINLAPPLTPATQLLLVHELQRAAGHLQVPESSPSMAEQSVDGEETPEQKPRGKSRQQVEALFESLPPLKNSLPAIAEESLAVLLLQGNPSKGVGSVEVAIVERIVPRQGWSASFLHRSDTTSELHVRLCDVSESSGSCQPRREGTVVLCPCHFICMLELEMDGSRYKLCEEDMERYRSMRRILSKLKTHQRALGDLSSPLNSPQRSPAEKRQASGGSSRRRGRRGHKKA